MFIIYYVDCDDKGKFAYVQLIDGLDPIDPSDCEWMIPGTYTGD